MVHGERFLKAIKPYSAQVFNIANEYKLSKERVILPFPLYKHFHLAFQTPIHLQKSTRRRCNIPDMLKSPVLCLFPVSDVMTQNKLISKFQVLEVSDHFPIEVELKTKSSGQLQAPVQPLLLIALSVITSALHILPSTSMVWGGLMVFSRVWIIEMYNSF